MATFLLSDLNAVKTAVNSQGEDADGVLALWLRTVSAEAAKMMNRSGGIEQKQRVETLGIRRGQRILRLRAAPITVLTQVEWDPLSSFVTPTILDNSLYTFDPRKGLLHLRIDLGSDLATLHHAGGGRLIGSHDFAPQSLRVTYTGGLATNIEGLRADDEFDDIESAVILQIHNMWKRQDTSPGQHSTSGQGGAVTVPALDWVPQAVSILRRHRRPNAGG